MDKASPSNVGNPGLSILCHTMHVFGNERQSFQSPRSVLMLIFRLSDFVQGLEFGD